MLRFFVSALLAVITAGNVFAITLEEVIANNLEARGGLNAIKKITTLKVSGTLAMQGMEAQFTQYFKNSTKVKMDIDLNGETMITAFDGTDAWAKGPFTGGEAKLAPAEQAEKARSEADIYGDFVNPAEKGLRLELAGTVDVDGSTAYKVKITNKDSSVSYSYIDAITWLEMKTETEVSMNGATIPVERKVSDYKSVDGVMFPMATTIFYNGNEAMSMKWVTVTANMPVDDSLFAFPGEAKK